MTRFTTRFAKFTIAALFAGFLAAFIPLTASAYKKHAQQTQTISVDPIQMMIDAKDLRMVEIADSV